MERGHRGVTSPDALRGAGGWRFPLLGLDISPTRIGLALAEAPSVFPHPLYTYLRKTRARDLAQCAECARRRGAGGVVIGLPLNMDGTPGPRARWMRRFARELRQLVEAPVMLQDERLTSVEADEMLVEQGLGRDEREERADAVAAALILRRFLTEGEAGARNPENGEQWT